MRRVSCVVAAALAVAACGDGGSDDEGRTPASVPAAAVAVVEHESITREDFRHWLESAAANANVRVPAPDPSRCIARKRDLRRDEARRQCEAEWEGLRDQVMQFLLSAEWVSREAAQRGIEVTDAEVRERFDEQRSESFRSDEEYRDFLRSSSQSEADLMFRTRVELLSSKVRDHVLAGTDGGDESAYEDWLAEYNAHWRERTLCAPDYEMYSCSNGPEPRTTTLPGAGSGP